MPHAIAGVIRGKMIELRENPGFSDGEEIEVIVHLRRDMVQPTPASLEGRPTAAGMLAHLPPEVDEELSEIIRDRKQGAFRELPE